jgi:hypothetical protein
MELILDQTLSNNETTFIAANLKRLNKEIEYGHGECSKL